MKKQGLNFSRSAFVEMNTKPSTEVEAGEEAAVFLNQWPPLSGSGVWSACPKKSNQDWFSGNCHALKDVLNSLSIRSHHTGRLRQLQGELWSILPVISNKAPGAGRVQRSGEGGTWPPTSLSSAGGSPVPAAAPVAPR